MFLALLLVSLAVAALVALALVRVFRKPIGRILQRLIGEDIFTEWGRYLAFAIFVVGVSGGVQVWKLERYVSPEGPDQKLLELTPDRWVLEIYRTIIGTLQSVAWLLLCFFLVALIAFVIIKGREIRRHVKADEGQA